MRSIHSTDGQHLAFTDGFGLTRISLPNKVKTDRKITAGLDALLSTNPSRSAILTCKQSLDTMFHLGFPDLGALTKFKRFELSPSTLTPDDTSPGSARPPSAPKSPTASLVGATSLPD